MKYPLECLGLALILILLLFVEVPLPIFDAAIKPILAFVTALVLGLRFPDLDLYLPGMSHRSGVTHSILLPAVMFLSGDYIMTAGVALGVAIHLVADCFPKAWHGGALVKLPGFGSIGKSSFSWLFLHCLVCVMLGIYLLLLDSIWLRYGCLVLAAIAAFWYLVIKERQFLSVLLVVAMAGSAYFLPYLHGSLQILKGI